MRYLLLLLLLVAATSARADTPEEVFTKRIVPIFKSPNPSSCTQCHLSGVDLKDYIRPTHRETFLSLRDQGMIDIDHPEKSKILHFIEMGKESKTASTVQQTNRTAEYDAFAAWVKASCADADLAKAPKLKDTELAKPAKSNEIIRHSRKDSLLESFENTVWAMRFRCASCHSPDGASNAKHVAEHGDRVTWLGKDAASTLDSLMSSTLINVAEPEKSPLLRKALNEVKHGGGVKFTKGDEGYKAYRRFIDDYAKIVTAKYTKASELPKAETEARFGTEAWLKIQNTPPEWADKFITVKVFAWDASKKAWQSEPIATSDRIVWGKGKLWQHNLTLHAPAGSALAKSWKSAPPKLAAGKYLVKVYLDAKGKLTKDWTTELSDEDYVGQAEIESKWPSGYKNMTVMEAAVVKK